MGRFDSSNGMFFYECLATTYFIQHKLAREKQGRTVALQLMIIVCLLLPFNWVRNRNKWAFLRKNIVARA